MPLRMPPKFSTAVAGILILKYQYADGPAWVPYLGVHGRTAVDLLDISYYLGARYTRV
jgi:hypothetical protein